MNVHCDWIILPLLLLNPIIWFSLDHKWNVNDRVVSRIGTLFSPDHEWLPVFSQTFFSITTESNHKATYYWEVGVEHHTNDGIVTWGTDHDVSAASLHQAIRLSD